jgi:hypothetical protein
MEFTLTIVAIVSAATALVMTAIVVSMLRNERRRSDARVEALVRLANADVSVVAPQAPAPVTAAPVAIPVSESFSAVTPSAREVKRVPVPTLRISDEFADEPQAPKRNVTAGAREWVELDLQPAVAGVGGLFAEPERESPWTRRLGIAAAVAILAVIVGFTISSFTRGDTAEVSAKPAQVAAASTTLELLTLAYEQKDATLTISGMVQNPKTSPAIAAGVEVTALVFAADGTIVASGKAPLDFSHLRPGDESPFVVRVPVTGNIARYRIGFRGDDGRVIAHVDRRNAGPLARNE